MKASAFNSNKYITLQTKSIKKRIAQFNKLYLEFGGKLFDDYHASRVLPGFAPDLKIQMLERLKKQCEVILCISAEDIESKKKRGDHDITYGEELLRLGENFRNRGITICGVVINKYANQPSANEYAKLLKENGYLTYFFNYIRGYPSNIDVIVSEEGFGNNPLVKTTKPLIVVTGPGAQSGKLSTCLSQLYNHNKANDKIKIGFAKFETFPVWNLETNHPINLAYEASTADIGDINMIDPFHLKWYGKAVTNYNRDIQAFPIVQSIMHKIFKKDIYHSPTDMGVNMVGFCIEDEATVAQACAEEIKRRNENAKIKETESAKTKTAKAKKTTKSTGDNKS